MGRLTASAVTALHDDLRPVAATITELAGKHGVAPLTVARHALLVAVPHKDIPGWDRRLANFSGCAVVERIAGQ